MALTTSDRQKNREPRDSACRHARDSALLNLILNLKDHSHSLSYIVPVAPCPNRQPAAEQETALSVGRAVYCAGCTALTRRGGCEKDLGSSRLPAEATGVCVRSRRTTRGPGRWDVKGGTRRTCKRLSTPPPRRTMSCPTPCGSSTRSWSIEVVPTLSAWTRVGRLNLRRSKDASVSTVRLSA